MTLKEISKRFNVYKQEDNTYNIHSLEEGKGRVVYDYLCTLVKNDKNFAIKKHNSNDLLFISDIDTLTNNINDYVNSLPFKSDNYNPSYREGVFEEYCIHDYLITLGLRYKNGVYYISNTENYNDFFNIGTLSFRGLNWIKDTLSEKVDISLNPSDSGWKWIGVEVDRNVNSLIEGVNVLLKPYLMLLSSTTLLMSEKIKDINSNLDIRLKTLNSSSLEIISNPIKDKMIKELESLLIELKK